ncbi:hypothetical protein KSP40_PGU006048 [Platanthera guangdongensis]|uniref:Uncharacterized protein n=1 Tax=Platanthera guangdongensis TaxID=2320717 RepID=A0ABR2MWQ0_9ASPA
MEVLLRCSCGQSLENERLRGRIRRFEASGSPFPTVRAFGTVGYALDPSVLMVLRVFMGLSGRPCKICYRFMEDGTKVRISRGREESDGTNVRISRGRDASGEIIHRPEILKIRRKPRPVEYGPKNTPLEWMKHPRNHRATQILSPRTRPSLTTTRKAQSREHPHKATQGFLNAQKYIMMLRCALGIQTFEFINSEIVGAFLEKCNCIGD